jgi:pimeloyl-ACP methyl ester carboxylesterase
MDSSAEPTLVLVHAFPMSAAMWDPQRADGAAVLPAVAVPTTIIVGDEDVITPPFDASSCTG